MINTPCASCIFLKQKESGYWCRAVNASLDDGVALGTAVEGLPDCPDYVNQFNLQPKFMQSDETLVVPKRFRRTTRPTRVLNQRNFVMGETEEELADIVELIHKETKKWPTHHQVYWRSRFASETQVYNVLTGMVKKGILERIHEPNQFNARFQFLYSLAMNNSTR